MNHSVILSGSILYVTVIMRLPALNQRCVGERGTGCGCHVGEVVVTAGPGETHRRAPGCGFLDGCCFGEHRVIGVGELPAVVDESYLVEGAGNVGLGVVDGRSGLLHHRRAA